MANITKKVSWSSRTDESGAAGEGTPLLNGSEQPRHSRQVLLARWLTVSVWTDKMLCHVLLTVIKPCWVMFVDAAWVTHACNGFKCISACTAFILGCCFMCYDMFSTGNRCNNRLCLRLIVPG